jgi:Putative auto-transporter adhesin, head GIN domain
MKHIPLFLKSLAAICVAVFLNACTSITGTGPAVTESRSMSEITAIELEMDADVYLIKGDTQNVVISAQQNILELIQTNVDGGNLKIKTKESISVTEPIQIWITVKHIEALELSGSGSISSNTPFTSQQITANISGSGKINVDLNCEKFNSDLTGSGTINLTGEIGKADIDLSGSGNIEASECEIDKCEITLNGSGDAILTIKSELNATINGSGSIRYSGNPHKVKSDINGSGTVTKAN